MNNLIKTYRKDLLNPKDWAELRKKTESISDQELENLIFADWMSADVDTSAIGNMQIAELKDKIDRKIKSRKVVFFYVWRVFQCVAVVLLPVFFITTFYLYQEHRMSFSEQDMVVKTALGERATVTLPDGTVVALNSDSHLAYHLNEYNLKKRMIRFSGEGYFQVKHDEYIPFYIYAQGIRIKVLGTKFNLQVRESDQTAELDLEEGSVDLQSTYSQERVVMTQNQKAIIDYDTGSIKVISDVDVKDKSAWRYGEMIFHNIPLYQVIQIIERNYDIHIHMDSVYQQDVFTGTLPTSDLNEVLKVLEYSYHLNAIVNGKEIVFE